MTTTPSENESFRDVSEKLVETSFIDRHVPYGRVEVSRNYLARATRILRVNTSTRPHTIVLQPIFRRTNRLGRCTFPIPTIDMSAQGCCIYAECCISHRGALLAVHQLGGEGDGERATRDEGECSDSESGTGERLTAATVHSANCQCMAQGGCHHVYMLPQPVRLSQMSSQELMSHNPGTPTGRACKWILNNCRGGRGTADKEWHFPPLWRMVDHLREV